MSKRLADPLEGLVKRPKMDPDDDEDDVQEDMVEGTTTIIIQQGDQQYATIVQQDDIQLDDGTLHGGGDEMTIQVPEGELVDAEGIELETESHTQEITTGHMQDVGEMDDGQLMEQPAEHVAIISAEDIHQVAMDAEIDSVGQLTIAEGVEHIPVSADGMEHVTVAEGDDMTDAQMDSEAFAAGYQNIIVQHMDIAQPLSVLRKLLESRLQCVLSSHEFWLQDTIPLEPTKNLTSQCVQGSGMVQINVEVKSHPGMKPRLNIVDILKPAEEIIEMQPVPVAAPIAQPSQAKVVIPFSEESENVTRWIVDQNFRKEQERLKIPLDPVHWNTAHVRHWLQWSIKEFSLDDVSLDSFDLTGKELCELKHEDFVHYIPRDKGDVFWTHLELLRKCKFVAVIQQPTPHAITTITVSSSNPFAKSVTPKSLHRRPRSITIPSDKISPGNRTGNNGQIQLWQFLLELLTDKDYREIIHWVGDEGEFKLNNPEMVAQLWGQRKNKPTMNYEKLSRALRYYYDGDMIAKVHGKRFVYKFVCDLRMLLGYTAGELNRLVSECALKKFQRVRDQPNILKKVILEAK